MLRKDPRRFLRLSVGLACLAVAPAVARAEPRTLREVLSYAREHAPAWDARRAERERAHAQARVRGFWLPEAPAVGAEWTNRERPGEGGSRDRVLEGDLTFEPFGQGIFRARAATAVRDRELAEVDAAARGWAAEVAWSWHDWLRWRWMRARSANQADISRRLAHIVERRYQAGDASVLEVDLAHVEAAEGERRILEIEQGLRQSEERLAANIGWPAGARLPAPDSLELVPALPDTTEVLSRGIAGRPELLVAGAALEEGSAETQLATSQLFPKALLGGFWGQEDGDDIEGLRVTLSVPFAGPELFERGARAAEQRRLEAEHRAATRRAEAQIRTARDAVVLGFRQVALFQDQVLPGIDKARQRYQKAYEIGQVDLGTVLLSEQRYREAEQSFAAALAAYIEALMQLEFETGLPVLSGYTLEEETSP